MECLPISIAVVDNSSRPAVHWLPPASVLPRK
jgi:hypothetical protein